MAHASSNENEGSKSPRPQPGQDSLESLIISLIELKSNIMRVEEQHPAMGCDLSSLCDIVIEHLNRPDDALPPVETPLHVQIAEASVPGRGGNDNPWHKSKPAVQTAPEAHEPGNPKKNKANPVAAAFDRTGDYLVRGLDRMGDGVIYVFEKLISIGSPGKKEPPEEETCA